MLKAYFKEIDKLDLRKESEEEYEAHLKTSYYRVIENYSWRKDIPSIDVVLLLIGDIKNYLLLEINDGKLREIHQEHLADYCLTCTETTNFSAN